jgi:uncharacterized protein (DUF433 family)
MDDQPQRERTPLPRNQAIVDDLRAGLTTREIAARHQVSRTRVSALRSSHHIGPPPPTFELEAVLADLRACLSHREIRERHGLTRSRLIRITLEHGLQRSPAGPHPTTQSILDDLHAGMSFSGAAHNYGKPYAAIAYVGKKYGIDRPASAGGPPRKFPKPPPPERKG